MAGKSIYPSIPAPGNDQASMRATLDAVRQTLNMVIMNAQNPSPNYTPSSAAQIFVTQDQLKAGGFVGSPGPAGPQGPPGPGIAEAPSDTNTYGRSRLAWQPVLPLSAGPIMPLLGPLYIQGQTTGFTGVVVQDAAGVQGWGVVLTTATSSSPAKAGIINPQGQLVLWVDSSNVVHTMYPVVSP